MKRYVLTGGPGVGKSSVIEMLAQKGYHVVSETARAVMEEEHAKKSDILPSKNLQKFQEAVAQRQLEKEAEMADDEAFLDRGIIDGYAYCMYGKVLVPKIILDHGKNRYHKVFLLAPLPQYENDAFRREKKDFQQVIHTMIEQAYREFGYDIIHVPAFSVEERVVCILDAVRA